MTRSILACTISISLVAATASAGQRGHAPAPKPAPAPAPHHATGKPPAGPPKTTVTHGSSTVAHGHGSSTAAHGGGHVTKTTTTRTTTSTKGAGHSKTTTTVATTTALSPVQQKLTRNTNLASKLQSRLPAGTDLMTAASGFRNLGQFVAAVNVSNNLGISFTDLKTRMVTDGMSLGQAIQQLRPGTDTTVVRRAETDADAFVRTYDTTTTTKTKSKSKTKTTGHTHGGD